MLVIWNFRPTAGVPIFIRRNDLAQRLAMVLKLRLLYFRRLFERANDAKSYVKRIV